ncbi:MAG: polysaccharide pyruvyl transferase family protein [Bacteroidetes bacterium]|nr:polysaccharide pyruvyl transferase family protein [Bacteroidota bacterium]
MHFFSLAGYNLAIRLYGFVVWLAALINPKAKKWIDGRKHWQCMIEDVEWPAGKRVWFHCASLGEFEQARPLIEKCKNDGHVIIISFFSPSGYEVQRNTTLAHCVTYLPLDTAANAAFFIDAVKPDLVFFTKYDFWFHFLQTLNLRSIPTILFSANFRKNQIFFKWYGNFFKEMLKCFNLIFVQNESSKKLLNEIGVDSIVTHDTRFDRVYQIMQQRQGNPVMELFRGNNRILIAGSTWPNDEALLLEWINNSCFKNYKFIIAPHDVDPIRIQELIVKMTLPTVKLSALNADNASSVRVIIVDSMGHLSSLYIYGSVAYVGGGFNAGIHNILEAAVYGLPIIFGPNHMKSQEAIDLLQLNAAYSIYDSHSFGTCLDNLTSNESTLEKAGVIAKRYVEDRIGGTDFIYASTQNYIR